MKPLRGWTARLAQLRLGRFSLEWYLVAAMLFLFALTVCSGVVLLMHYQPAAERAHGSVQCISTSLPFGQLARGLHGYSANLLVAVSSVYVFCLALRRTYRAGGELIWLFGLASLAVVLAAAFTGTVLVWDRDAHTQARVSSAVVQKIPLLGSWLRSLLLGGEQVTAVTLSRAFAFHAVLYPILFVALAVGQRVIWRHRLQTDGAVEQIADAPTARATPLYPEFALRAAALCTGLLLVVCILATTAPLAVGEAGSLADPAVSGVGPPWYLLFLHQLLRAAPATLLGVGSVRFIVVAGLVAAALTVLLPFVDRRGSRITYYVSWLVLAVLVALTAYGSQA